MKRREKLVEENKKHMENVEKLEEVRKKIDTEC